MKKESVVFRILLVVFIMSVSCQTEETPFTIEPPLPGYETKFSTIKANPQKDSIYALENGTRISIQKGSLLDSRGNPIQEPVDIRFRQFDDAVSIFLSGLPMQYSVNNDNMVLQTAGMYEIRGEYNDTAIQINPDRPVSVTIGSFFEDPRMGFFKLDEETGSWNLVDIPESEYNDEVIELREKISTLKPEWEIPLPPGYYIFSFSQMVDIFLNDNYTKIYNSDMEAMSDKMKKYGVESLDLYRSYNEVKYKGNSYEAGEMLWKSDKKITVPKWIRDVYSSYYDSEKQEYKKQIIVKPLGNKYYQLSVIDYENNRKWSTELKLITHLRYLTRYTPEQLIANQEKIEKEIQESEERLKKLRIIEYTTDIYEMGIYNCDKPIYFREGMPTIQPLMNRNPVAKDLIHRIAVFNYNLSSYAQPASYDPLTISFFKGNNKIILITREGEIGLFSGSDFQNIDSVKIRQSKNIELNFKTVDAKNESELREFLRD